MRTRIKVLETRLEHSERILRSLGGETHPAGVSKESTEGNNTERIYHDLAEEQASDGGTTSCSQENWESSSQGSGVGSEPIDLCASQRGLDHFCGDRWTTVTADFELIRQLHLLYFSWEHAACSLFSKYYFIDDRESGRQRYCSPLLVNAIAALGCKFSGRLEVKRGFDNGEKFYMEAKRIWEADQTDRSITTIQATALMSLWEANQGQHSMGAFYARQALSMAVEGGLHRNFGDMNSLETSDREVRSATFWGVFTLDQ